MKSLIPRPHRPRLSGAHLQFGRYIRERRQAKRLTLRACAAAIGLAPGHWSNVENGRIGPPDEPILVKLAAVLDVPIGALLSRAGRLSSADLQRFWESPLIISLVQASTGWNIDDAAIFQQTVLASLQD
jgi:transcriptional regulator with XRE-family HTH domain